MPIIRHSLYSCADSKSLCEALISSNPCTSSVHNSINFILSSIFIQWIPGHFVIPGNELANKSAKESTTIVSNTMFPVSFSSYIQAINETICDDPTPKGFTWLKTNQEPKRWHTACLFMMRQPAFSHRYLHHLDPSHNPICLKCCLNEQDLNHWLCECPAGDATRQKVFGNHKGSLEWLATRAGYVVAYARKTLVNVDAKPSNIMVNP